GCVAQAENSEIQKREPYIDIVIGPQSYHKINETILEQLSKDKKTEETEFDSLEKFNYLDKIKNQDNKISSFLTIQEGCDKFCSFCVVPFTRGPEYSRPIDKILNEAEQLVKNGVREITLLGQNVNAYNYQENNRTFKLSDLILKLEKISELKRIRYTTSHPRDMSDDLIECYSLSKKLMPLVHLPVQSGSNKILKLMNRKHTVEDYLEIYKKIKKINPKTVFASDFIVAHPEETDLDFKKTMNLVNEIKFTNSFSFIFSARPGTVASNLEPVKKDIAKKRLQIIQEKLFYFQHEKNKKHIDKTINVLIENKTKHKNQYFGRAEDITPVFVECSKNITGETVKVNITKSNKANLFGNMVS
ncbi:MAG: tRNA (N6-isopentenyl adenosine(37)-C2)-methylthiotransferase MiaB, partial [Candidatus Pelagibacter sp.]